MKGTFRKKLREGERYRGREIEKESERERESLVY